MAVEYFSRPSLHERMCRTWGSNSGPLACQADMLPIELPRPAVSNAIPYFRLNRMSRFAQCIMVYRDITNVMEQSERQMDTVSSKSIHM